MASEPDANAQQYIRSTFASARHGISINGLPPDDLPQEEERQGARSHFFWSTHH